VPGRVLDVDATRVLWVDAATPRNVRVRDRASGSDAFLVSLGNDPSAGYLFTGGVVVVMTTALGVETMFEWRGSAPATETTLTQGTAVFDGEYAAWRQGSTVFLRNLQAGTTVTVSTSATALDDVGPNGDVLFTTSAGLQRWRGGTVTTVPVPTGTGVGRRIRTLTDGVNVAYETFEDLFSGTRTIWLAPNGTDAPVALTVAGQFDPPTWPAYGRIFALNGGWTAYAEIDQVFVDGTAREPSLQVRRRSPSGVDEAVTPEGSGYMVDAVGPDGTVIYRTATRRFIAPAGGGAHRDLGPAVAGETVFWRGGRFYLLTGGAAYELSA